MKLRPYQEKVIAQLNQALKTTDEVVIASAPNSGKTLMAIEFMKRESKKTFLVLTHGTIVLKEQWSDKFEEAGLTASTTLGKERITYGLPQSLHKKNQFKIDYLIIDEAHEFRFASMVQKIIKEFKPNKIINLTGTPSKFIAKGYKTIIVPAIDLIKEGFSSDLYVGMVSTSANINKDDRNAEGDIKDNKTYKLEATVDSDLDALLASIHTRLCETGAFKGSPRLRKTVEWAPTLGKLHKTMIACRSIIQANKVEKYFDNKGIMCLVSHSLNDIDSGNIQLFKTSPEYQVLIVVDRGILGLDMHDLVNVVDLTCSKDNINRIYQLYARVMRKSPDHPRKYFFKFSSEPEMHLMRFYMNAALMLMFEDFISRYNGKNLNGMRIPILRPRTERKPTVTSNRAKRPIIERRVPVDQLLMQTVEAGAMLIDIYNKIGQNTNEYAYTTFKEVLINEFKLKFVHESGYWTLDRCIEESKKYQTRGEWYGKSPSSHCIAHRNGWIDKYFRHLPETQKPKGYWNKQRVLQDGKRFETVKEWRSISNKSYVVARKNKWLNECCGHMIKPKNAKANVKNLTTGQMFKSIADANKAGYYNICRAIKSNIRSNGHSWAYCDEHGNIIETKKKSKK
jgi:superfamily II DNA or RNA helicase